MTSQNSGTAAPKLSYKATAAGLVAGLLLCFVHPVFILSPLIAFLCVDLVSYRSALKEYNRLMAEQREREHQLYLQEQRLRESKKIERQIKAEQKKNREDKGSLYRNIYTVAGFVLALQQDLDVYIKNAEDVLSHFRANDEERCIAVEAFNSALDENYDIDDFIYRYMQSIGKNRDYISCVLTYALMIASSDGSIQFEAKERLVQIGKALGSSEAALKRLFKSNGAEARFAREFDEKEKADAKLSLARAMLSIDENDSVSDSAPAALLKKPRRSSGSSKGSQKSQSRSSGNKGGSSGESAHEYERQQKSHDQAPHSEDYNRISEALEILGLTSKATFDDLKKAHKKMMLKYHPDRLASQGLPEDMILVYTEKAKAVQVAFEYLKDLYNEYA